MRERGNKVQRASRDALRRSLTYHFRIVITISTFIVEYSLPSVRLEKERVAFPSC